MAPPVCQCACSRDAELPTGLLSACARREKQVSATGAAMACTLAPTPAPSICWEVADPRACAVCCAHRAYPYALSWTGVGCPTARRRPNVGLAIGLVLVPVVALVAIGVIWYYRAQLDAVLSRTTTAGGPPPARSRTATQLLADAERDEAGGVGAA